MQKKFEYTLATLPAQLPNIWNSINKAKVVVLMGDLGAGKTTFLTQLFTFLQVKGNIASPTFSIINEYSLEQAQGNVLPIFHIDLYRIEAEEELFEIGLEELLTQDKAQFFIEWPQIATAILPNDTLLLNISSIDENTRSMKIAKYFD